MRPSEITMDLATGDATACHKNFIMLVLNVAELFYFETEYIAGITMLVLLLCK
jgi:hypothetical protein